MIYNRLFIDKNIKKPKKLITFFIQFHTFKYLIMLFDYCNNLVFSQYFINNIWFDFLYYFIQTYLDNIFIYYKTLEDYYSYICLVLEYLKKAKI